MPTPKRNASSKKPSGSKKNDPVLDLASRLSKTRLANPHCDFSMHCPKLMFTCRDENKNACVIELLSPLPGDHLKHCKVLPGGKQLSILLGYPKVLASERCHRKQIQQSGEVYSAASARVMARSTQVTHYMEFNFADGNSTVEGTPQIVDLPFLCMEGEVPAENIMWIAWPTDRYVTYRNADHKQFLNILNVKVISIHTFAVARGSVREHVLDDSEESDDDQQQNVNMNGMDDDGL
jgi:hypothetical protein